MAANCTRSLFELFIVDLPKLRSSCIHSNTLISNREMFPLPFTLYSSNRSYSSTPKSRPPKRRGEYLFGVSPCLAALRAGRRKVHSILVRDGTVDGERVLKRIKLAELQSFADRHKVGIHWVNKGVMERVSGNRPTQGIIMDVSPLQYKEMNLEECQISDSKAAQKPLWLALDEIQDPMNLGAILRCAFYLGVDKVIVTAKNCCPLTPTVSKASSGAMEWMRVHSVKDMAKFFIAAKESGWSVVGTCKPTAAEDVYSKAQVIDCAEYHMVSPTLLILGNEGHGVRKVVEQQCDCMLTIPSIEQLPLGFDSLNVGVATGILLHALQRTRQSVSAEHVQIQS